METTHVTVTVEREFSARRARVFAAWRDAKALARWYVPGDEGWSSRIVEHDFRVGGRKALEFGPRGEPPYGEDCRYEDIVDDTRLIFSMRISTGSRTQTVSLVTVQFFDARAGTRIVVTDQMAIPEGGDTGEGRKRGWGEVLDKLGREVA
jgi:uncharacterized protein YndB with AHSA1/START domain